MACRGLLRCSQLPCATLRLRLRSSSMLQGRLRPCSTTPSSSSSCCCERVGPSSRWRPVRGCRGSSGQPRRRSSLYLHHRCAWFAASSFACLQVGTREQSRPAACLHCLCSWSLSHGCGYGAAARCVIGSTASSNAHLPPGTCSATGVCCHISAALGGDRHLVACAGARAAGISPAVPRTGGPGRRRPAAAVGGPAE